MLPLATTCLALTTQHWAQLYNDVGGRLYPSVPFSQPCFSQFSSSECREIQAGYLDETYRSHSPTAFIQSQWESCQATNEHCLLDWRDPQNENPTRAQCHTGSLSQYHIDVKNAEDVIAAIEFSRCTEIPLSIRNTGHDYKGRSSAPGSLGLWLHHLQDISYNSAFVPEGCSNGNPYPGVTMGAGVQWNEAHDFANNHNITLLGGSDKSVGAVGGWLQGGGHGALSNTMGLGADRVLQYKVVTPDGTLRTANECQNDDLFWALRGGGGGTFGVVLEATVLASPPVKLQALIFSWTKPNAARTREAWTLFAELSPRLAEEGWGGYVTASVFVLINPKIGSWDEAMEGSAIKGLVDWGKQIQDEDGPQGGVLLIMREFPTWHSFFQLFTSRFVASVGKNLAIASGLVPKSTFRTPESRNALVDALMTANTITSTPGVIILFTTPASTPDGLRAPTQAVEGKSNQTRLTSVHPAWRDSLYHITSVESWNWNATKDEIGAAYRRVSESVGDLRKVTTGDGGGAAYVNEADVYEPNFETAFWGDNYPRLLEIKSKYDPDHLLDCWHCVGFERSSARFGCYIDLD